jgi:hypothetical protein
MPPDEKRFSVNFDYKNGTRIASGIMESRVKHHLPEKALRSHEYQSFCIIFYFLLAMSRSWMIPLQALKLFPAAALTIAGYLLPSFSPPEYSKLGLQRFVR